MIVELVNLDLFETLTSYKNSTKARLVIPSPVQVELNHPSTEGKIQTILRSQITEGVFEVIESPREMTEELRFIYLGLGDGEVGTLALASKRSKETRSQVIPLLDDKLARKAAKEMGLQVHGTLWLIMEFKRQHLLKKEVAVRMTKELRQHGFYISERKLSETIREIERDC